jgi:outer membrane protein with beta-barrel domain
MANLGATDGSTDSTSAAFKVGAGYQFNTYNGLELAYHHGGTYTHHLTDGVDSLDIDVKLRRVSLVYVLSIPATSNLSFNLRAGVQRWEEKVFVDGEDAGKRNDTDATWGVGAKYRLGERTALTLDYHTFHQQEDQLYLDFGELMAGVQIRF